MNLHKKIQLLMIIFVASAWMPSFAVGQKWPVEDTVTQKTLEDIKILLQQQYDGTKLTALSGEKNTTVMGLNQASIAVTQDLKKAELNAAPSIQKCIELTKAKGSGQVLSSVAVRQRVLGQQLSVAQNSFGTKTFDSITNMEGSRKELCSIADTMNGIGGCEEPGALAGWTEKFTSLLKNPIENNKSLNNEQVNYGREFIENSMYALAPDPADGGKVGATSVRNAAMRKIWQARASTSVEAMQQQLAYSSSIDLGNGNIKQDSAILKLWNSPDMKAAYDQLRGTNSARPTNPSLMEIDELNVLKGLYYSGDIAKLETATSEIEVQRIMAKHLAMNNYLQMQLLIQLRFVNAQLFSINANQLAPVNNKTPNNTWHNK